MLATFNPVVLTGHPHDFCTEFTQGSGIAPALYAAAIKLAGDLESDSVGEISTPIYDALNWRYSRFGLRANQSLRAALLLNEDSTCWQAKLASPKLDPKTGKSRKYETPIGNGSRAFLPPVPPVIRQQI